MMKSELLIVPLLVCFCFKVQAKMKPSQNPKVIKWIKVFQRNDQNYFNSWLLKSDKKLPKIRPILKKHGLPTDLAYLPIIESGLNPKAVSSANAVGYWQFMEPTAKQYGLRVNWWLDERRDLIKSTWAASRYLSQLYKMFGDWHLALSAYNMGENRLKRLIRRHGTRNFWVLSEKPGFPKETKDYVPKFLAAALIAKNPKHYGFNITEKLKPFSYTYQFVPGGTDLSRISKLLKITPEELEALNPELKRSLVPKTVASHRIRVPKSFKQRVAMYFKNNSNTL
jgi:membrane-bound lytic murein transglycosylase D